MPRVVEQFTRGPRRPQPWRQQEFDARVRETLAWQHFAKTLGIELVSIEYGRVSFYLPVWPLVLQQRAKSMAGPSARSWIRQPACVR